MTERPTYLPMLEAIANAERQGHEYYSAWYEHATDPDLKETMRIVANFTAGTAKEIFRPASRPNCPFQKAARQFRCLLTERLSEKSS